MGPSKWEEGSPNLVVSQAALQPEPGVAPRSAAALGSLHCLDASFVP